MANICENKFFLSNDGNDELFKKIKYRLIEDISHDSDAKFDGEVLYEDDDFIEGWFDSRWTFPNEYFEEIIPEGTEDIYFRCLSEEYGCCYVAMNVFKDGTWLGEQTFDF